MKKIDELIASNAKLAEILGKKQEPEKKCHAVIWTDAVSYETKKAGTLIPAFMPVMILGFYSSVASAFGASSTAAVVSSSS